MGRLAKAIPAISAALALSALAGQAQAAAWFASDAAATTAPALHLVGAPNAMAGPHEAPSGDTGKLPEPATWAMLILGFGAVGSVLRRRRMA